MVSKTGISHYLGGIGRALSASNYRIYWYGHLFSSNGVWIYLIASQWLMFYLIQSPAWLGLVGFSYLAPLFFLGPLAGAISDRYGHRRTGVVALSIGILMSLLTATAIFTGLLTPFLLVICTLIQGVFMSFDFPARQALIPQLVEREDLSAAIGMNTATFHTAGFIGPVLGGFILSFGNGAVGEPFGAALSYTVSAIALSFMVLGISRVEIINPLPVNKIVGSLFPALLSDLNAGVNYIIKNGDLKNIMCLSVFIAVCLRSYQNLMAGFAEEVFLLDEQGLGNLLAASGIVAHSAALILSIRGKTSGLTRVYVFGAALTSLAVLSFVSNAHVQIALFTLVFVGGFSVATSLSAHTLIQNIVIDQYRARVISVNLAISVGGPAFGTLAIGWLAEFVGFQLALGVFAFVVIIAVVIFGPMILNSVAQIEAANKNAE